MALEALRKRKFIDLKNEELAEHRKAKEELQRREAELTQALDEAASDEDLATIEEEMKKYDEDKEAYEAKETELTEAIATAEKELEEIERAKPQIQQKKEPQEGRKMDVSKVNIRSLPKNVRALDALPEEARAQIVNSEEVKAFLTELRAAGNSQRAISGGELTIPVVMLDLIAENMYRYSKLINRIRVRDVRGEARQTIAGTVPEAVWTEMCGAINELTFVFNQVTLDGFKVAGYVPVCNSLLEDSDVNLAGWIVEMLAEAIGLAKDKAILYGKGAASKMPMGIVTRLAQTEAPADYPASAPAWENLSQTNIQQIDASLTGAEFWAALTLATGNTFTRYSRGNLFWAMNSKTYALLKSKVITFTATGDIAANVFGTLPVITGDIDILEFIPDGDIIGGYGDLYLWAQRAGMTIESDRSVQFIQDNTVFRGKERADGMPVVPGAFVAININGQAVTTSMTFAADTANNAMLEELTIGEETLTPAFDPDVLSYAITTAANSDKVEVTAAQAGADISISYGGKNVRNGGTVTWTAGTNPLAITIKNGNAVRVYTVNVTKQEQSNE